MKKPVPVFVADTCIGGLSVVKSMWKSGTIGAALFMADYAVNPLGVKDEFAIAEVVRRWLGLAEQHSDTLVIACNTLSVRYHQLLGSNLPVSGPEYVVTMVDCFKAMVSSEKKRLANRKILVIGTEFTASQSIYPDILEAVVPGAEVSTIAATDLERKIARFQPFESERESALDNDLKSAIEMTDVAVLACTCFPMVKHRLEHLHPETVFLDPGVYCAGLLDQKSKTGERLIQIMVTGNIVTTTQVMEFAGSYLGRGNITSCQALP